MVTAGEASSPTPPEKVVPELRGSTTHDNLKSAFGHESRTNRLYLYFAKIAAIEGHPDVASQLQDIADGRTGHAHGHLDFLKEVGDPMTGMPMGETEDNLRSAVTAETAASQELYAGMAQTAHNEGFHQIANWFETLGKADAAHAERFASQLDSL
jgi:rubrerythrin